MFAQAAGALPDPTHASSIGWVVLVLAALVHITRNVMGLWREVSHPSGSEAMAQASDRYQPRGDYVTRAELEGKLVTISDELESMRGAVVESERRSTEASEERIKSVHARLDIIPDRIITQLSNLGVLRRPNSE